MSDFSFICPVYLDGKLVGAVDIARLLVPCPGLYSEEMMRQWKHILDFDKQETFVKEFGLTFPFKDTVPILDIFQMPEKLSIADIPPRFRSENPPRKCLQVSTSDINPVLPATTQRLLCPGCGNPHCDHMCDKCRVKYCMGCLSPESRLRMCRWCYEGQVPPPPPRWNEAGRE